MRIDIVTIFPDFFSGPFDYGIVRRACQAGLAGIRVHDLREFTKDRHRTVDDRPFGGGEGMVLKPEPLFEAVEALLGYSVGDAEQPRAPESKTAIVLMSAAGKLFHQETARRYAQLDHMIFICGRYEGVDERVADHLATEEISIGDFVLSGGELPAVLVIDAVTRLLPGALGNEASSQNESFSASGAVGTSPPLAGAQRFFPGTRDKVTPQQANVPGASTPSKFELGGGKHVLLDFPHYTRPAEYRGWSVPEILIGGNHKEVANWRRAAVLEKTHRNRPDLLLP